MTLGLPSRRSHARLETLDKKLPSPCNVDVDSPGKNREKRSRARGVTFHNGLDTKMRKATRRRVPFILFAASISVYCCIVYLNVASQRAIRRSAEHRALSQSSKYGASRRRSPEKAKMERPSRRKMDSQKEPIAIKHNDATSGARDATAVEIVHVVQTRFMQGQAHLVELGLARLSLFEAFCLPTMLHQTSKDFIWIIRVDPEIHPSIALTLVQLLDGNPNFVLLGSNDNPEGFGRTQSPFDAFIRGATVMSGNVTIVQEAYDKSAAGSVLLETRLDADDGLHLDFIKTVQEEAKSNLVDAGNIKGPDRLWRLWCSHSNFEWHPLNPFPVTPEVASTNQYSAEGFLVFYSDKSVCSTPGLTFGYGRGASRASLKLDHLRHDEIARKVAPCNEKDEGDIKVECVSRLKQLAAGGAVRARTTTSAGMNLVLTGKKDIDTRNSFKKIRNNKQFIQQYFQQKDLWAAVSLYFAISLEDAQSVRSIVVGRQRFIAEDNLRGQCTKGHSCKKRTREILERIANSTSQ